MEPVLRKLTPILKAAALLGGKTRTYELVGQGVIVAVKLGSRTMIDTASLANYLDNLPPAKIAPPRRRSLSSEGGKGNG